MTNQNRDLENAVLGFLQDTLHLKKGQRLLLYTDQSSDRVLAKAMRHYAEKAAIPADLFVLDDASGYAAMEKTLLDQLETGKYSAACELSDHYFYHTSAWKIPAREGCRLFGLGAIDIDGFVRCIGQVNKHGLQQFGDALYQLVSKAGTIRIHSDPGTDITMQMGSFKLARKVLAKFKLIQRSRIWPPSGTLSRHKGSATFMSGQAAFIGIPDSIEGTAVVDGCFWPPEQLGRLDSPVTLTISKGQVAAIDGRTWESRIFAKWLAGKPKHVAHFCVGFNPGARLDGRIMEAERAFGTLTIGIGSHPFHTDGVIRSPGLEVDQTPIMQNNTFIGEPLSSLAKRL